MIKRIIAFLLIAAAFCTAHANAANDIRPSFFQKDSVYAEQYAALTQVDFDNYYKNLIQAENDAINKASIGFFIGIFSTGFGVMTIATAFNSGGGSDWVELNRHILKFTGIGLTVAGVTGISYGLYTYFTRTGQNSQRASYERAYEIYKRRRSELKNGAQVLLTPTINIPEASGGMILTVLF